MTDDELLVAVRRHWAALEDALGDAHSHRVDDGSTDPDDVELARRYRAAADALGMSPQW